MPSKTQEMILWAAQKLCSKCDNQMLALNLTGGLKCQPFTQLQMVQAAEDHKCTMAKFKGMQGTMTPEGFLPSEDSGKLS